MIIWHNDTFKNEHDFSFSLRDRVRYGDGIFDTLLCVDGVLVNADDHVQRLYDHAAILRIPVPYAEEDIIAAARDVVRTNSLNSGQTVVNTFLSRGSAPRGLMPPNDPDIEMVIMATAARAEHPSVHAIISKTVHRNEGSPLSRMKSFNYGDNILGLLEAKDRNANEAIFLNNLGNIACATTSNIYVLKEGILLTPQLSDGAMEGIIRKKLIAARKAKEQSISAENLQEADGVFLSNSVRGLFPVLTCDGKTLPIATLTFTSDFHTKTD